MVKNEVVIENRIRGNKEGYWNNPLTKSTNFETLMILYLNIPL